MTLQNSLEYKAWVDVDKVVAERIKDGTLITITREDDGFNIYRTFRLGNTVAVSVDAENVRDETVFSYLLRKLA